MEKNTFIDKLRDASDRFVLYHFEDEKLDFNDHLNDL